MSLPVAAPSVGFFPNSFPRDPVEVNVYLEHNLLGQVIEPLVESGSDGSIVPAAASTWKISNDGLTIHFFLTEGVRFSNGKILTAADVKYTLERHIHSVNSQSKSYLKRIQKIELVSPEEIVLHLATPYVAILKALSRDHLGIVPQGWKFDPGAPEPFIGTGPYRALRENGGWVLRKNLYFRFAGSVAVAEWNVVFQKPSGQLTHIPDLVPFAYGAMVDEIKDSNDWLSGGFIEEHVTHFFQSSAWWCPHGKSYRDPQRQKLGMCAMEELVSLQVKKLGLHRATGLIPAGIAGHLAQAPTVECTPAEMKALKGRKFTVVALSREFPILNDKESLLAVKKKYGVELVIRTLGLSTPEIPYLKKEKPDIFVLAFAGGFQDPEGFLTVITAMLGSELETIFQGDYPTYLKASSETDWAKRSPRYQLINKNLVSAARMVPGWKVRAERVRGKRVVANANDLRYTAKLRDYKLRKEEP